MTTKLYIVRFNDAEADVELMAAFKNLKAAEDYLASQDCDGYIQTW